MAKAFPIPADRRFIDMTGQKFHRLRVLHYDRPAPVWDHFWLCQCQCGNKITTRGACIRKGITKSCGCLKSSLSGMGKTPECNAWRHAKSRCYNPKDPRYPRYGARGIRMCWRWKKSFENFLSDMGPRPSPDHSLHRIDNDRGYRPDNCVWTTREIQCRNRRTTRLLRFRGKTLCIRDWAKETGLHRYTIWDRLRRKLPVHLVLKPGRVQLRTK